MEILAPISLGELIDKISILEIKSEKLSGFQLKNVLEELQALSKVYSDLNIAIEKDLLNNLKKTNQLLWEIEDKIRDHERNQLFDSTFIELARSVYKTNDARSAIKRAINQTHGSPYTEEKSYSDY